MIYLGSDHGGFPLKEKVKVWLKEWNLSYEDCGAATLDPEDDYPQFAIAVAEKVAVDWEIPHPWTEQSKGILFCRSSGGVVITANKVPKVRAVAAWDEKSAGHAREHNNANIIAIAGDWTDDETAKKIVEKFLHTDFSKEERHVRRIQQISEYEDQMGWASGGGCGGCGDGGCCS